MPNTNKITEEIKTDLIYASTDATGGETSPLYVGMAQAQRVLAVVSGHIDSENTIKVQMLQAKDSDGSDSKDLGDEVTFTNSTGTHRDMIARVEKKATDLDDGFTHVGVKVTAAADVSGVFIRTGLTFRDGEDQTEAPEINVTTTAGG